MLPVTDQRIALDNYEASVSLNRRNPEDGRTTAKGSILAFGPERGWGPADRDLLRASGFMLAHLGSRVLRVETAVVAALAITCLR
jgi:RsmE family RNA methyltransferase